MNNKVFNNVKEFYKFRSIFEKKKFADIKKLYEDFIGSISHSNKSLYNVQDKEITNFLEQNSLEYKKNQESLSKTGFLVDGYTIKNTKRQIVDNTSKELITLYSLLREKVWHIFDNIIWYFACIQGYRHLFKKKKYKIFSKKYPRQNAYMIMPFWDSLDNLFIKLWSFCNKNLGDKYSISFKNIPSYENYSSIYSMNFLSKIKFELNFFNVLELCSKFATNNRNRKVNYEIEVEYHGEKHIVKFSHNSAINGQDAIHNIEKIISKYFDKNGFLFETFKKIARRRHSIVHNVINTTEKDKLKYSDVFNFFEIFYILTTILLYITNEEAPQIDYSLFTPGAYAWAENYYDAFKMKAQKELHRINQQLKDIDKRIEKYKRGK